jgi:starch synthase
MARCPRVLFVASEAVPYAKTGGLADVAGSLPEALAELGCEVDVIMPLYKCVREKGYDHTKTVSGVRGPLGQGPYSFDIYTARGSMVRTHFADCPELFDREGIYGNSRGDHPDNAVRFGMFSRAVLDSLEQLNISPDIIHCNDWQTALIPLFLRFMLREEGLSAGVRTLFTIHNMAYQGIFHRKYLEQVGVPRGFFNMHDLEYYGKINFMKSGILYSDAVSTVSHRYAEEIMTPEYGCGLDGLLRNRKMDMYGIPNGVDYSIWNPERDGDIAAQYGPDDLEGKKECKRDLIKTAGLALGEDAPLLGCVSRLAHQKGMDLVADITDRIVKEGAGLVMLGTGSRAYNRRFMKLAEKHPGKVHVCTEFNDPLAHKIEAGCDIFLMPSRFEPCGLNQMYSIKYGTVPVVRATGGLDDVIVDIDAERGNGNGFKFRPDTAEALLETVMRAMDLYRNDREAWKKVMLNGMRRDHSWNSSARTYLELYRRLCA